MSEEEIEDLMDIAELITENEKLEQEIERLNKENKELKEQVVSAIRVNNICTENKSIVELQAQRYEQELTIAKENQLKEKIERLHNENKILKEAVKETVIATCNTCEDYGICPHSYREYDLDNIIKRLEEDLREMYLTFGEFSEEYTEKKIKELKGSDKE